MWHRVVWDGAPWWATHWVDWHIARVSVHGSGVGLHGEPPLTLATARRRASYMLFSSEDTIAPTARLETCSPR